MVVVARRAFVVPILAVLVALGVLASSGVASAGRDPLPIFITDVVFTANFNATSAWWFEGAGYGNAQFVSAPLGAGGTSVDDPTWLGSKSGVLAVSRDQSSEAWRAVRRTISVGSRYEWCRTSVTVRPYVPLYSAGAGHRLSLEAVNPATNRYLNRTRHTAAAGTQTIEGRNFVPSPREFVIGFALEGNPSNTGQTHAIYFDDYTVTCGYTTYP